MTSSPESTSIKKIDGNISPRGGFWLMFHTLDGEPELTQIEFEDPSTHKRTGLIRGHTAPHGMHWSSFVWSKAVRALSILLVRRALFAGDPSSATLCGGRGSLASSLGYAISKQPAWLMDLFGADAVGRSLFCRMVLTTNPELKRPGPITITLKSDRITADMIHISIDHRPASRDLLEQLLRQLESEEASNNGNLASSSHSSSQTPQPLESQSAARWSARVSGLPRTPVPAVLDGFLSELRSRQQPVLVLEDDAAGLQLAVGIPSVLENSTADLQWLLESAREARIGFVTHPSRGHDADTAARLFHDSARRIAALLPQGGGITWATRFDSCLRGHNLAEMDAVKRAVQEAGLPPFDLEIYAPSFYQHGRITIDGTQLVAVGDDYCPVSETEYAKMPGFEYSSSKVLDVVYRSASRSPHYILSAETLRSAPLDSTIETLSLLAPGTKVVIDGVDERDTITAAYALSRLEKLGRRLLLRSAPSLLLSLTGQRPVQKSPVRDLSNRALPERGRKPGPGLVVAGSLSGLSKLQLRALSEREDIALVALDPAKLKSSRAAHIRLVVNRSSSLLKTGFVPLITTRLWEDSPKYPSAEERDLVLDSLAEIVREIGDLPSWLLLKGSDTCLHVMRWGVRARRVRSIGSCLEGGTFSQVIDGGSTWSEKPIVLFPGNVGDDLAVSSIVETLAGEPLRDAEL